MGHIIIGALVLALICVACSFVMKEGEGGGCAGCRGCSGGCSSCNLEEKKN